MRERETLSLQPWLVGVLKWSLAHWADCHFHAVSSLCLGSPPRGTSGGWRRGELELVDRGCGCGGGGDGGTAGSLLHSFLWLGHEIVLATCLRYHTAKGVCSRHWTNEQRQYRWSEEQWRFDSGNRGNGDEDLGGGGDGGGSGGDDNGGVGDGYDDGKENEGD